MYPTMERGFLRQTSEAARHTTPDSFLGAGGGGAAKKGVGSNAGNSLLK